MTSSNTPEWFQFFLGIQQFIMDDVPYSKIKSMLQFAADLYGKEYVIAQMKTYGFSQLDWIIGG